MKEANIEALLTSRLIGRPLRLYQEVTSTNDIALKLGEDGAPEGFAIFAETQTKGRGRLGRTWESSRGASLTFSILLRPTWPELSRISLFAAVAVAQVLERLTPYPVGIKWPNDIFINGKKIAGILCEAGKDFVVVGIGLNILQNSNDFPSNIVDRAASLAMFCEGPVKRAELAAALLNEMDCLYENLPETFPEIIEECERRSVLLEKKVEISLGNHLLTGIAIGMDKSGGLKIRQSSGLETIVSAGEVTLLRGI